MNLFTREFLTKYVTFGMRRSVGWAIDLIGEEGARDGSSASAGTAGIRVMSLDVVAVGSYRPEWMVVVRIRSGAEVSAEDFAVVLNSLAKTHLPTFNKRPCFIRRDSENVGAPLTPFEAISQLLRDYAPRGVADSFESGVVDSRAKVIAFAAHSDADVRSEDAVRAALWLAGGVHSVSGMNVKSVLDKGHAVLIDLFNNWIAVCTLDGIGIVFDPGDDFANTVFRDQVLEAYWMVYADSLGDVVSVDRFLRRPTLDLRRRRELLRELTEFGQLNRQWSSRGTNAFPVASAIRTAVERLHDFYQRLALAERRADSISSGVIAVANHRFSKALILVAILTAGNVIQSLAQDQSWLAPLPLAVFLGLLAGLVLVFDPRMRTAVAALLAGLIAGLVGLALVQGWLLPAMLNLQDLVLVIALASFAVAATMATFYRNR